MGQEIERAYAVNQTLLPPLDDVPSKHLSQVYFTPYPADRNYTEVASGEWRVRTTTEADGTKKYKAAVKFGDKASGSRTELEVGLAEGDFGTTASDVQEFGFGVISKTRYDFGDDLTLDHFDEADGFEWLAEKEFEDEAAVDLWTPPAWCEPVDGLPGNRAMARALTPEADAAKSGDESLVQAIIRKQKQHGHVIVTFSGMSGSGKSTAAQRLANHFGASYIEADHYHIGATELQARHGDVNHDLPHAYDYKGLAQDVARLLDGQAVQVPRYDFASAERMTDTSLHVAPSLNNVTFIDGLYAKRVSEHLQELVPDIATHDVLINTPLYVCVLRRLMREAGVNQAAVAEQRTTSMDAEATLSYLHKVAIPTYRKYAHHPELFDTILGN